MGHLSYGDTCAMGTLTPKLQQNFAEAAVLPFPRVLPTLDESSACPVDFLGTGTVCGHTMDTHRSSSSLRSVSDNQPFVG